MPPRTTRPINRSRISVPGNRGVKVVKTCTIRRPALELYEFWRNFSNLPRIIEHPVTLSVIDDTRSEWSVSAPFSSQKITWTSEIVNDDHRSLIAWRSIGETQVPNAGSIRFETAPGDEGTEVTVSLEFDPPGGKLGALFSKLSPEAPARQVSAALRRFKALLETGEIPTIKGQSVGEPQRSKQ